MPPRPKPIISTRDGRRLASIVHAAEVAGVSVWTIRRLIYAGRLPSSQHGEHRTTRVDLDKLRSLMTPIEPSR